MILYEQICVKVKNLSSPSEHASLDWASPSETFPRFIRLLEYPAYTYSVLLGLTVSVGGITGFLVSGRPSLAVCTFETVLFLLCGSTNGYTC